MSITYTYTDALNFIASQVPRMVESDKAPFVCNLAISEIWKQYDWRQSLTVFPPFYLIPGEQDHGAPAVAVPSDFLGLREVYLVRMNSTPVFRTPLTPMKDLELTHIVGPPQQMGYEPSKRAFRIFPRVPINLGVPDYVIQGTYKKLPAKITSTTLGTALPFDDQYFFNLVEVFRWAAFLAAGDQRAGGVQSNNHGMSQYTGQYAAAQEAIDQMAETEGFELGDVAIAPKEPLATTFQNNSGIYGRLFG